MLLEVTFFAPPHLEGVEQEKRMKRFLTILVALFVVPSFVMAQIEDGNGNGGNVNAFYAAPTHDSARAEDFEIFGNLEPDSFGVELDFDIIVESGELADDPEIQFASGIIGTIMVWREDNVWSYRIVATAFLGFGNGDQKILGVDLHESGAVSVEVLPTRSVVVGADWKHGSAFTGAIFSAGEFKARWLKNAKADSFVTGATLVGDSIVLEITGGARPLQGAVVVHDGDGNVVSTELVLNAQVQDDNGSVARVAIVSGGWMATAMSPYVRIDASGITDANGNSFTSYSGDLYVYPLTGDVNGSGSVDFVDAVNILSVLANYRSLMPAVFRAADTSGNGKVTVYDAALVLQYNAGIISVFPADAAKGAPAKNPKSEERLLREALSSLQKNGVDTSELRDLQGRELTLTLSGAGNGVSPAGKRLTTLGELKRR